MRTAASINASAVIKKNPNDVDVPVLRSYENWSCTTIHSPIFVGTMTKERLHHAEVATLRSDEQWRGLVVAALVHAGAAIQEEEHNVEVVHLCGNEQGGFADYGRSLQSALVEQRQHPVQLPTFGRVKKLCFS